MDCFGDFLSHRKALQAAAGKGSNGNGQDEG
jgi:hypothetical protein